MEQDEFSPEMEELVSDPVKKLDGLYNEAQILKMFGLKKFLKESRTADAGSETEAAKAAQQVLNAITLQLRILGELEKGSPGLMSSLPVEVIWEAMLDVPELRSLLTRDSIRKKIIASLEKNLGPETPVKK